MATNNTTMQRHVPRATPPLATSWLVLGFKPRLGWWTTCGNACAHVHNPVVRRDLLSTTGRNLLNQPKG